MWINVWALRKHDNSKISYLAWTENIVHVLKETLVFNLVVSEYERKTFGFTTGCSIQQLEVFHQVTHIVRPVMKTKWQYEVNIRHAIKKWIILYEWRNCYIKSYMYNL